MYEHKRYKEERPKFQQESYSFAPSWSAPALSITKTGTGPAVKAAALKAVPQVVEKKTESKKKRFSPYADAQMGDNSRLLDMLREPKAEPVEEVVEAAPAEQPSGEKPVTQSPYAAAPAYGTYPQPQYGAYPAAPVYGAPAHQQAVGYPAMQYAQPAAYGYAQPAAYGYQQPVAYAQPTYAQPAYGAYAQPAYGY